MISQMLACNRVERYTVQYVHLNCIRVPVDGFAGNEEGAGGSGD